MAKKAVKPIDVVRPEKKIAIYGTTPSRMEGPIGKPDWKHWTIGPGGKDVHHWDRLFEMHNVWPEDFKGYLNDLSLVKPPQEVFTFRPMKEAIRDWAKEHNKDQETFAKEITGDWAANVVFPRRVIEEMFPRRMWFSSSISWLIALAIYEGATDIGLWGIDLESGEEYISQFVGCAHLLDVARLMGVNIHLPAGCGLLRDPNPYPDRYETQFALETERKVKYLQRCIRDQEAELEATRSNALRVEGRLLAMRELSCPTEAMKPREEELMRMNANIAQLAANVNTLHGELGSTQHWRQRFVIGLLDPC